jgi:hypothetical protein
MSLLVKTEREHWCMQRLDAMAPWRGGSDEDLAPPLRGVDSTTPPKWSASKWRRSGKVRHEVRQALDINTRICVALRE